MTQPPLVSVLMTSHNREKYIALAIESVLASTFTDFELIITDDRSTDQTVEIAQSYMQKDPRVRVYINEKNLGDYNNRNRGASYAKGKYLKYLDSDDIIYPHAIAAMVQAMELFPDAAFGFSYYGVQIDATPFPIQCDPANAYYRHFFEDGFFYAGPGGAIINREKFEAVGGFSGKRFVGDTELWMKLGQKFPVVVFYPGLIWWRIHEGQESVEERLRDARSILSFTSNQEFLSAPECPLNEDLKQKALRNNRNMVARRIWNRFFTGSWSVARELKKECHINTADLLVSLFPINRINKMLGKKQ